MIYYSKKLQERIQNDPKVTGNPIPAINMKRVDLSYIDVEAYTHLEDFDFIVFLI